MTIVTPRRCGKRNRQQFVTTVFTLKRLQKNAVLEALANISHHCLYSVQLSAIFGAFKSTFPLVSTALIKMITQAKLLLVVIEIRVESEWSEGPRVLPKGSNGIVTDGIPNAVIVVASVTIHRDIPGVVTVAMA